MSAGSAALRTPEELVAIGFQRSRIVIVNECHAGDRHCPRTRAIGRRLLPVAHEVGVRHLAMEALYPPYALDANRTRQVPNQGLGYLGQHDMQALIADALALGWDLVAYECDFERRPGRSMRSRKFANWRDLEEARNLARFLAARDPGLKLLVWCGHSHQRKVPQRYPGILGGEWVRLGQRLREITQIDPFVIDQSVTVRYPGSRPPPREADATEYAADLDRLGGTAGFLREEDPNPRFRLDASADAWLLSLDNEMA